MELSLRGVSSIEASRHDCFGVLLVGVRVGLWPIGKGDPNSCSLLFVDPLLSDLLGHL